jgi:hypothetical protein
MVVEIGDAFVDSGRETPSAEERPNASRTRSTRRQSAARKRTTQQASRAPKDLDDVAVARKVETVIFRDRSVAKGKIDVNAADGVVWLRGEAKTPEQIKELERQAAAIPEVKKVENLLHLPKSPARRPAAGAGATPRKVETRVTNEGRSAIGEDLPIEAAHEHEGRQPAPFGSHGGAS